MNWTSTAMPDWETHCENLLKSGDRFELRDVTGPEQNLAVQRIVVRHGCATTRNGHTVTFHPAGSLRRATEA